MPKRQSSNVAEGGGRGRGRNSNALSVRGSMRGRGRSISINLDPGSFMLPPLIHPALNDVLGVWPQPQSSRDKLVGKILQVMVGPSGYTHRLFGAAVPDPGLARRAAAAMEAEGYASACEVAARTSLDSAANRCTIFRLYVKFVLSRLNEFRTTYATDADAAFAALGLGVAWREWNKSSSALSASTAPLLLPPPAAPAASEAAGASSSSATAPPLPAAAPPSCK